MTLLLLSMKFILNFLSRRQKYYWTNILLKECLKYSLDIYHTIIFMNDSLPFCESLVIIHRNLHSKFCLYLIIIKYMQLRQQTWVYLVISYPFVKLPMYNHRLSSSALHRNLLCREYNRFEPHKLQQTSAAFGKCIRWTAAVVARKSF